MRKVFTLLMIFTMSLLVLIPSVHANAQGVVTKRIAGADRFEVAANIASDGWQSATTVVLTNYLAFADALSAAPYAKQLDAPILLTEKNDLTQTTSDEIKKLGATHVIIVGGTGSVSSLVESQLKSIGVTRIDRIGGSNRFDVAKNIANNLPNKSDAVLANGMVFSDALAIAPYAAKNGYPILLTESTSIPNETKDALNARSHVIVVGGPASVSDSIYSQLPNDRMRIGGANRYDVAVNIVKQLNLSTDKIFLATGSSFADALTGSVLAAKNNEPLLLTLSNQLPDSLETLIKDNSISDFTILGGGASVSQNLISGDMPLLGYVIAIDPGHAGAPNSDPGAMAFGVKEGDINLGVANYVNTSLSEYGAKVVMTRTNDSSLSDGLSLVGLDKDVELSDRIAIAQKANSNIFVSIHTNSFTKPSATGTETDYHSESPAPLGSKSEQLAEAIQKRLVAVNGLEDRGIKDDPGIGFKVLRDNTMPASLVELGFITNPDDVQKLTSASWQKTSGQAIAQGILDYFQNQ